MCFGRDTITEDDLSKAFERNLAELQKAIIKRRALVKLDPETEVILYESPVNFFYHVAFESIKHDIWWHAFRVFDTHNSAIAWKFLRRRFPKEFKKAAKNAGTSITQIRRTAASLLPIRNKTRAHIDILSIRNPKDPYDLADMKWREFDDLIQTAFAVLSEVHQHRCGEPPSLDVYDATDVHQMVAAYEKAYPGTARIRLQSQSNG